MKKLAKMIDFVARWLEPYRSWNPIDLPTYMRSHSPKRCKIHTKNQETSFHNSAYTIPGRDYLTE